MQFWQNHKKGTDPLGSTLCITLRLLGRDLTQCPSSVFRDRTLSFRVKVAITKIRVREGLISGLIALLLSALRFGG